MNVRKYLAEWENEARILIDLIPSWNMLASVRDARFGGAMLKRECTALEIANCEARLGAPLPPDVRSFYEASNGWMQYGFDEYDLEISSVSELHLVNEMDEGRRSAVVEYGADASDEFPFSREEASKLLCLSRPCRSGLYALAISSAAQADAGTAVVIRFHGTPRNYHTFWELLVAERSRCLRGLRSLLD